MATVAVLGGGIAGLTAAYHLERAGVDVEVLERRHTPGGMIQSSSSGGYLVEHGPSTIRESTPALEQMIDDLGLRESVVEASDKANKRFIVRDGKPVPLPSSPASFLTTRAFSIPGKIRLLMELLVEQQSNSKDESVAAFVRRRFGREALEFGADPMVAGIFSGNPDNLSVAHAFPTLPEMENNYGSVIKALLAGKGATKRKPRYRIFNFQNGMQQLISALVEQVGDVRLDTRVVGITREDRRWTVEVEEGFERTPDRLRVDGVISTLPLHKHRELSSTPLDAAPALRSVSHPPLLVIALGYPRRNVDHKLDGFGMLVPRVESGVKILGTIFTSTLFPNRAPEDHVLLTSMVGGARRPALTQQSLHEARDVVERDLRKLLGVRGEPMLMHYTSWTRGIPQYNVGYGAVKRALEQVEQTNPGFTLAGNYRQGISVPDTMQSGRLAAERLLAQL